MKQLYWLGTVLLLAVSVAGCERAQSSTTPPPGGAPPKPPPAEVFVTKPETMQVTDFAEYIGHLAASQDVTVLAHVGGYLDKINFKDGATVREGDVLFEIDPTTFQADLDSKEALLVQGQRHADRLKFDLDRVESLVSSKTISQETYDQRKFDYLEALASNLSLKANRDASKDMLDYTKVAAKISGRVSRRFVDRGNLVVANETKLAEIVQDNPIYAYFDVEEPTLLKIRRLQEEGKMPANGLIRGVSLGLIDEKNFSAKRTGDIDYIDSKLDPQTGTLRYRAVFANPKGLLSSDMQMKVRVPLGDPHSAVVIPESALGSDQNRKFVYVVKDNKAIYRPVKVGIAIDGGKRAIDEGLAAEETFIISGLQRVRPDSDVIPKDKPAEKPPEKGSPTDKPAPVKS